MQEGPASVTGPTIPAKLACPTKFGIYHGAKTVQVSVHGKDATQQMAGAEDDLAAFLIANAKTYEGRVPRLQCPAGCAPEPPDGEPSNARVAKSIYITQSGDAARGTISYAGTWDVIGGCRVIDAPAGLPTTPGTNLGGGGSTVGGKPAGGLVGGFSGSGPQLPVSGTAPYPPSYQPPQTGGPMQYPYPAPQQYPPSSYPPPPKGGSTTSGAAKGAAIGAAAGASTGLVGAAVGAATGAAAGHIGATGGSPSGAGSGALSGAAVGASAGPIGAAVGAAAGAAAGYTLGQPKETPPTYKPPATKAPTTKASLAEQAGAVGLTSPTVGQPSPVGGAYNPAAGGGKPSYTLPTEAKPTYGTPTPMSPLTPPANGKPTMSLPAKPGTTPAPALTCPAGQHPITVGGKPACSGAAGAALKGA